MRATITCMLATTRIHDTLHLLMKQICMMGMGVREQRVSYSKSTFSFHNIIQIHKVLCGTDNIMWNIFVSISNIGIFYAIFPFPQKNGMDMDNVMLELFPKQGRDTRHGINRKAHLSLNAILLRPYIRCLTNYMIFLGVFTSWTMKSSH